jgi:hypothetical protein
MRAAVLLPLLHLSQGAAAAADCPREAATLSKEQADLPRLEIASPKDRPPYCITLETLMAFGARVKAHIAQCPSSDYAPTAAEWLKSQPDFRGLFAQYRCKRTL